MKQYRGIVFDFNGTLLWDTKLHNQAWDAFLLRHDLTLSDAEKNHLIHGKTNEEIFTHLFNNLRKDEIQAFSEEKESFYRNLCLETKLELAEGAIELFEYCLGNNIKIAIATSANKPNIDFYIHQYHLLNWFSTENIVFNDGLIKSKPHPEIFLLAIKKLHLHNEEVIIFEDSKSGINAALNSHVGKIIIVNSNNDRLTFAGCDRIDSFKNFNYQLLSRNVPVE